MFAELTIEDATDAIIDYRGKTPPKSEAGIKLITAKVIKNGTVDESRLEFISEDTYSTWMRRGMPQTHDVLLTTEAPLGEVAMLRGSERIALAQRVILLRAAPDKVDPTYLFAAMRAPLVQARLQARATGTTVLGIKQSELRKVEIPVPPMGAQKFIGSTISAYDELIENNTRRIKILEEMAQSIYKEWFVNFRYPGHENVPLVDSPIGPIPEGWDVGVLDDLVVLQRGFDLPKRDRGLGDVPVIAAAGQHGNHSVARVAGPGVVTGRSGSLGVVTYVPTDFWPLNTTLWVKEYRRATPQYAYSLLQGLDLASFNSGAAVPTLNRNDISHLRQVLAPRDLVSQFSALANDILGLVENLKRCSDRLRTARSLLLPRLMSGEVDLSGIQAPS